MNRLTRRYGNGESNTERRVEVMFMDSDSKSAMCEIIERLAQYEDLGLTPEQIREVDRLYAEKCREVAELKKSSWIPVTERLPEDFDSVLVCDRDGYIDIAGGWYVKDKWWWNTGNDVNCDDIIAWMPLPEPYTESVEE